MSSTSKLNCKMLNMVLEPKQPVEEEKRNWLEIPSDVMSNILFRIGVVDILENAQKVCTTWRKICKEPTMWTVIYMKTISADANERGMLREICKHAVDRSQGQLVDITVVDFGDDNLLEYIADRSSQLRRLEISCCHSNIGCSWTKALKELTLLEELVVYTTVFPKTAIETVARCCPMLRTLKLNEEVANIVWYGGWHPTDNERAIAIGENLPELRHLELIGNNMSNNGLQVILDGCRQLESLDLRQCFYINLEGDIWKRCSEKIKFLKLPKDSLEGCPYITEYKGSLSALMSRHFWDAFLNVESEIDFFDNFEDDFL